MKRWWILKGIKITFFVLLMIVVMGYLIMTLWNWLLPGLLGASMINFWQALGILALSKLLFGLGRWGHRGYYGGHWKHKGGYWQQRMEDKLKNMSPEDREKFREEWKRRCGHWGHTAYEEEKKGDVQA